MRQTILSLLQSYQQEQQAQNPTTLIFVGVDGYDVYNPSMPFIYQGKELILARVEKRDSEVSKSIYFEKVNHQYAKRDDLMPLDLQDPCITMIEGDYVVGGTYVYHEHGQTHWYTKFYKGKDLNSLKPALDAPDGMKDVRLVELPDHRIGVFTRPQGKKGKRGHIGFDVAHSFDDITKKFIDDAPLFEQFIDEEWGGANHLMMLDDKTIGVLGHIANFTGDEMRHYYPMTFTVNIETRQASPMKIIAVRDNFNPGPSKRDDLVDVLFSAALIKTKDDLYELYVGVSDAEVQKIDIVNPFNHKS